MISGIILLVISSIATGPLLAKIRKIWLRRLLGWVTLVSAVAGSDCILTGVDPIIRMVGICCVLLAGMKGLVYAEWAVNQKLTLLRYLVFSIFWFGMDPGTFLTRKRNLSWKIDVRLGLLFMSVGTLGASLVWFMEWRQILILFVPMSLGFHFGALRVLKGFLRAAGHPVRTLFPNLLQAQGIGDFWSRRWNIGYSQMMQRLVGRPIAALAGENTGLMAIFFISGLLHEIAITLPVRSSFGLPTVYFTFHGILTLIEKKRGRPFGKVPALLAVGLPLGILFPPTFQNAVIARCLGVFDFLQEFLSGV